MNGTFMVSLDLELFWGMLEVHTLESYQDNILGGKKAIPQLLQLFEASSGSEFTSDKVMLSK